MNEKLILSDDQVAFFRREGYLAIDQLTDAEDVAFLRVAYDRLFAEQAGRDEGNEFDLAGPDEDGGAKALPQILNPARYAPEMLESRLLKNATIAVRQLLGEEAHCGIAHAILKPARHGAATPWHQDASYWNPAFISRNISIWVPLQEATLENGCMHFVPHSHELDVVRHQSINNDPRIHGLELHPDERHLVKDAVARPLPPGGATFHGGYMLHFAPPNRSDQPRRALILNGSVPPVPRETPRTFPWLEGRKTPRQERAERASRASERQP